MAGVSYHHHLQEVSYAVSAEDDVYQVRSLANRIQKLAWEVFTWVAFPLRMNLWIARAAILPASALGQNGGVGLHVDLGRIPLPFQLRVNPNQLRELVCINEGDQAKHLCVQSADGTKIDGMLFWNQEQRALPVNEQKYVICFNGNGAPYEFAADYYRNLANDTGANVLTVNLRGTILSEGIATVKEDLYLDGEAALLYLTKELGVPENQIVIKGHSLGGGIASAVASKHPAVGLFLDRTFTQVTDVVQNRGAWQIMKWYVTFMLHTLGFNLSNVENAALHTGPKTVLYSDNDGVIPPGCNIGSVAGELENCRVIHVRGALHMSPMQEEGAEAVQELFARLRERF